MRAAVMRRQQLHIEDVPEPVPGPGQVLVETLACGICGSDLHVLKQAGTLPEAAPSSDPPLDPDRGVVMGHEFSARVVALGEGASEVAVGDIVVSVPVIATAQGIAAVGYSPDYPGGYGERMVLTSALCLKVPPELDPRHAALTEPMAVGRHAVVRSGIVQGEAALVLGCGPIGLAVIAALRLDGIEPVVAADFSPARRRLASELGAGVVVDPREEPAIEAWRRVDGSRSLVIFEAVGVPGMLDEAITLAPQAARILVVGACLEQDSIWPLVALRKELTIQFAFGYTPQEFAETLRAMADGAIGVAPLITGAVGIAGVPQAFASLANPDEHVKVLVEPALG